MLYLPNHSHSLGIISEDVLHYEWRIRPIGEIKEIMKEITLKELLEAGCHFGHKTNKWNPKSAKFIYKPVGDTHIIDLIQTKKRLEDAAAAIISILKKGGEVVFVGTKRQATAIIKREANRVDAPFINSRWIGGLITNWQEVRKNIQKLLDLEIKLANKKSLIGYTKKEQLLFERDKNKLVNVYGGIRNLERIPDALFIADVKKEFTAIREAVMLNIPIIGIVDTNSDPNNVTFPIPANDDAVGSVKLIVSYIADAYKEGKEKAVIAQKKVAEEKEKQEKKIVAAQEKDVEEKKKKEKS